VFNNVENACQPLEPLTLRFVDCPQNVQWPTVLLISKRQGMVLKEGLAALATGDQTTTGNVANTELPSGTEPGSGDPLPSGNSPAEDGNSTSSITSNILRVKVQLPVTPKKVAFSVVAGVSGALWGQCRASQHTTTDGHKRNCYIFFLSMLLCSVH
jgi:hypothetical protein